MSAVITLEKIRKLFRKCAKRISEDNVYLYAAQASFYILIASIPFIMMLISLLRFFIPIEQIELAKLAVSFVPSNLSSFVSDIIAELYSKSFGPIFSITALTTLWSASRSVNALRRGLNDVYGYREKSVIAGIGKSIIYTLMFIVMFVFFLTVFVFGSGILSLVGEKSPWIEGMLAFIISLKDIIGIILAALFFCLMYRILPIGRNKFLHELPGAIFASVSWAGYSYFYSIYIYNYSNYSFIYGSLTAVVLLMTWLYFGITVILIGAEINAFAERKRNRMKITEKFTQKNKKIL